MTFHDGVPLTAEDVACTYNSVLNPAVAPALLHYTCNSGRHRGGAGGAHRAASKRPERPGGSPDQPCAPDVAAQDPPHALGRRELNRLAAAAHHATRAYPGAVGELLARELRAHADFGYRFDHHGLMARVARQVLATPAAGSSPPRPGQLRAV